LLSAARRLASSPHGSGHSLTPGAVLPERIRQRLAASRQLHLTPQQLDLMADRLCPTHERRRAETAELKRALLTSMRSDFGHVPAEEAVAPARKLASGDMCRLYEEGVARKKKLRLDTIAKLTEQTLRMRGALVAKAALSGGEFDRVIDRIYTKRVGPGLGAAAAALKARQQQRSPSPPAFRAGGPLKATPAPAVDAAAKRPTSSKPAAAA
jgi:hypothetical protein